jgi:universal stress protein A
MTMSIYKYILLATDFTEPSKAAAKRAAEIAACVNARLCLLHVIEHFPGDMPNEWIAPEDQDPAKYLTERSMKALEQLGSQLKYDGFETRVILSEHSAVYEITQFARQNEVDLIVTGHPAHHGVARISGSTNSAVMHRAECDTLSVHVL